MNIYQLHSAFYREEGYKMKTQINTQLIYPPPPNRAAALAAADPTQQLIA
jgi:hypothetical protein